MISALGIDLGAAASITYWGDATPVRLVPMTLCFLRRRSSLWIATSTCRPEREGVPAAALCRLSL